MIVSIHQPDYIPWLGLYYKVAHSDVFVYLDDAQYSNEADHNVNKIKTPQGELKLKVPVEQHMGDLICNVRTKDELKWKEKHLKTIKMNYSKAEHFSEIFPQLEEIIMNHSGSIAELNMSINKYIFDGFDFSTRIMKSSDLLIDSVREERVIDICLAAGGTEYLSGNGARVYQVEEHFTKKGLKLTYLNYEPIEYKQLWPKVGFLPYMSALDYIFNCGFDWEYVDEQVRTINGGLL
ncbi:MAG: WbqC family protein [Lachnospiraceae bacterium]|nr:WbqC family protein [Lachnospiraceae bacterium]